MKEKIERKQPAEGIKIKLGLRSAAILLWPTKSPRSGRMKKVA